MGLNYRKNGRIAMVGLDRPKERNALDAELLMDLHRAWQEINADEGIRVAILHSCLPDIFCSGMDLRTAIPILTGIREPGTDAERWLAGFGPQVGEAMLKPNIVRKPVIAAVNGYCLTGGFEMIMGADLRLACDDAVFQMREASLGIMPTGGSNVYLPRMIAPCRAMEILLTAENYPARTLLEWGFLNKVVPAGALMDAAEDMAGRIAANGPLAVQGIIRFAREGRDLAYAEGFRKEVEIGLPIFRSADAREGVRAQKEKRKADFPGRYA